MLLSTISQYPYADHFSFGTLAFPACALILWRLGVIRTCHDRKSTFGVRGFSQSRSVGRGCWGGSWAGERNPAGQIDILLGTLLHQTQLLAFQRVHRRCHYVFRTVAEASYLTQIKKLGTWEMFRITSHWMCRFHSFTEWCLWLALLICKAVVFLSI